MAPIWRVRRAALSGGPSRPLSSSLPRRRRATARPAELKKRLRAEMARPGVFRVVRRNSSTGGLRATGPVNSASPA